MPTVICPRCKNDTLVLHWSQAVKHCASCGGVLPDLRYSAALGNPQLWNQIVHDGALKSQGMVPFASVLSQSEIDAVRAYVTSRANEDAAKEKAAAK